MFSSLTWREKPVPESPGRAVPSQEQNDSGMVCCFKRLLASAKSGSGVLLQVWPQRFGGLLGRLLKIERSGEASLFVHQIDDGRMIHRIRIPFAF